MLRTPNIDAGNLIGSGGHDHAAVRSQLARILGSSHFKNSKRSQSLLRFVVEASLTGDQNSLKERQIGAAVFGRETAYDTAQDPVVRNAAIEVRKRLAQYYLEPEHVSELRIDLPSGAYMPTFAAEIPVVEVQKPVTASRGPVLKWYLSAATLSVLVAVAVFSWGARTPLAELEGFWEPLFRERKPVQICIGQPSRLYRFVGPRIEDLNRILGGPASPERKTVNLSIAPDEVTWVAPEYLFMRDALSAFKVAAWIQSKGRTYELMSVSQTNYSRLRHEAVVAIGAFNNPWSMRATAELRFLFDRKTVDGITYSYMSDRRNPTAFNWKVPQPVGASMTEDFAIVTRVFDSATEKTVISAAGIETYGTLAASEFVTGPDYLGVALRSAPSGWRHKNVQFVLGTKIIDGTPGPPRILAAHYW